MNTVLPPNHQEPELSPSLCSRKRDDQGLYECEVWSDSREGASRMELTGAEGSNEWKTCTKNPGHLKFIPPSDFCLEYLPKAYRTEEVLELVHAVSDLTVRLRVQHTSAARPDGYPFCNFRGRDVPHTGTGVVTFVGLEQDQDFTDSEDEDGHYSDEEEDDRDEETRRREYEEFVEEGKKPAFSQEDCPCHDCEDARLFSTVHNQKEVTDKIAEVEKCEGAQSGISCSPNLEKSGVTGKSTENSSALEVEDMNDKLRDAQEQRPCWLVFVETALHVVYDTAEARRTVVDAFYDTNTASARSQNLYGFCVEARYEEEDRCSLKCATHNEELVRKLFAAQKRRYELNKALGRPILRDFSQTDLESHTDKEKTNASHTGKANVSDTKGVSVKEKTDVSTKEKTADVSDKDKTGASNTGKEDTSTTQTNSASQESNRLAIVIGHPHGRSKTICVGQWTQRVKNANRKMSVLTHYIYDTPTCKGNSGGAVLTFGDREDERVTMAILTHRHRSACRTPGLNMSSPSHEYTHEMFPLK